MQPSVFDTLFTNTPTFLMFDVVINMVVAFILGLFISILYRKTFQGFSYSSSYVNTLVIITMVTAIVIMVIGNNLARAFGLVGAMSIIRFRTVLKDTRDIAFVFFALAVGMASGSGNHLIGIVGSVIIGIIILALYFTNYGTIRNKEFMLSFWMIPEDDEDPTYLEVFRKYLSNFNMLNVRSVRLGQFLEMSFSVVLKRNEQSRAFMRELSSLEGIERVSLVLGDEIPQS
ncbi:DUF4956 domain-containing protein [candidate division KSB1 bacterium]|nr:DUF4956 domain-containing protein [candidate division KSB1 bacterium]